MKNLNIITNLFLLSIFTLTLFSCNEDEVVGELNIEVAGASYDDVLFTRISDDEVRADVYMRMGVSFNNVSEYSNLGVYKIIVDEAGNEVSKSVQMDNITPDTYTRITIESAEELFNGLSLNQNQWQENYSFKLASFGVKQDGGEQIFDEAYEFTPEYNVLEYDVAFNEASEGHVDYIRTSETVVDGNVNINLTFTVSGEQQDIKQYTNVGIIKHLLSKDGTEIDTAIAVQNINIGTEFEFSISSIEDLYNGIDFDWNNNLEEEVTFSFTFFAETKFGETVVMDDLFTTTSTYVVKTLPTLETGIWIAKNDDTGFTKEIEIIWDEENQMYFFTDFGIDWSNANDFWYGTMFSLKFSESEDNPVYVDLTGWGWDTSDSYEMLADDGVTYETRVLRIMPYAYQEGSAVGYYDNDTGNLVFDGVNITDLWWNWDKHQDLHFTFSKK